MIEAKSPTNNRWLAFLAIAIGVVLLAISAVYFIEPARSLPQLFPGRQAGSDHHHVKHGIAALLLGAACFVFAWFRSAPAKSGNDI